MSTTFTNNPAEYFDFDNYAAHQLPPGKVEKQQIAALNERFQALKDQIGPLGALASAQKITSIESLDDAAALLFPHTIYKTYPEELLLTGQYGKMTEWLSRLTTLDLSAVASQDFETMDDWMDALDLQTDMDICHSSGTTGRLSFHPRGKYETDQIHSITKMKFTDRQGDRQFTYGQWPYTVIWPAQSFGRTSILRGTTVLKNLVSMGEEKFHPYLPTVLSSDHHYYVMRCKNLLAQGIDEAPQPSDYVYARLQEAEQLMQDIPMLKQRLLDLVAALKYKERIMMFGTPLTVYDFARSGLDRGMENMFMADSFVNTAGGFKNVPDVPGLMEAVKKFTGDQTLFKDAYGMTELITGFDQCDADRFHIPPWIITYLLDPETGELLPSEGRQKGRAAFFDLPVQTYWGGTVTADLIEIDWGQCRCGRTTPTISPNIVRMSESPNEHYIGTASKAGIDAALEAMGQGLAQPH